MSPRLPANVAAAGIEALRTGWLTMGPRTQQLETALRERFGVDHAIATSSGTAALHLTLIACGAELGARVLIPSKGPPSHAGAAEAAGAEPVAYGEGESPIAGSAALVACPDEHLGGLASRCRTDGVHLIEDHREEPAPPGAGVASILSFSSQRRISCGEGGAVLTDSEEVADRVRSLRSHAMTSGSWDRHRGHAETYDVVDVGFNYRIDEIRAAMLEVALTALDER